MRKISYILIFFVASLQAQQFSLPSQIDRNFININPAYTGIKEATVASFTHRSDWVNSEGTWSFQNFELHAPLKKQNVALGLQARNESIGLRNNTELFFSYAHRIIMENSTLAFSLKAGGQSLSYDEAKLDDSDYDPAFESNSSFIPNAGFGVAYYSSAYYVGFSVPYFFGVVNTAEGTAQIDFEVNRLAYILSGGGSIPINTSISLEPYGAIYYTTAWKPQALAVLNVKWNDVLTAGAGYRLDGRIVFNAVYDLNNQFSIGYSYDYFTQNSKSFGSSSSGSHELGVLYYFGYKVNTVSPRDF